MDYQMDYLKKEHCLDVLNLSWNLFNTLERFQTIEKVYRFINKGFVCKYKDEIVGYVVFDIANDQGEDHFIVMSIGVSKDHQHKGIGSKLLKESKNYFKNICGILKVPKKLYLHVRKNNEKAKKLYIKENFKQIGIINGYYQDPYEDCIHMLYF
jgi:ribosomal protein S18 acetylase RimI-like enzyme